MDIEKLKALALAAQENDFANGTSLTSEFLAFTDECNPAAVLELIAEVERLRADAGRLDFVDRSGCAIRDFHDQRKNVIEWIAPGDLRGAIDAAIEKEKA